MKKHLSFVSEMQLWRIIIDDSDRLILETRDTTTKEVFFQCYNLLNAEKIFTDLQLEEKSWIGIDTVYNGIIYFHHFPKRDLPTHKGIIAFDINKQKEIWKNDEFTLHFALDEKVYAFTQGFDERSFVALDCKTGELIEDIGNDFMKINHLRSEMENNKEWSNYIYSEKYSACTEENIKELIDTHTKKLEITGEIEYSNYKNFLFFNYHLLNSNKTFTNNFLCLDISSGKMIHEEVLNKNVTSLFADSFFVYKNFLFLLIEKNGVVVYRLD